MSDTALNIMALIGILFTLAGIMYLKWLWISKSKKKKKMNLDLMNGICFALVAIAGMILNYRININLKIIKAIVKELDEIKGDVENIGQSAK